MVFGEKQIWIFVAADLVFVAALVFVVTDLASLPGLMPLVFGTIRRRPPPPGPRTRRRRPPPPASSARARPRRGAREGRARGRRRRLSATGAASCAAGRTRP